MKNIFLIDCPGIVPPSTKDTEQDILLRGVVRVEHVDHPEQYIPAVLERCQKKYLERTYEISGWENATEFIEKLARKGGRLLKGGEPDESGVSKQILNDFNRGKIPWFVPPPERDENEQGSTKRESLKKRKLNEDESESKDIVQDQPADEKSAAVSVSEEPATKQIKI